MGDGGAAGRRRPGRGEEAGCAGEEAGCVGGRTARGGGGRGAGRRQAVWAGDAGEETAGEREGGGRGAERRRRRIEEEAGGVGWVVWLGTSVRPRGFG